MTNSRLWITVASIAAAVVGWLAAPQIFFAQNAGHWTPLAAEMTILDQSPEGATVTSRKSLLAVRADGSRADLFLETNQKPDGKRKVTLLNERRQVMVDPSTESNTTYPLTAYSVQKQSQRPACEPAAALEKGTILGYTVYRFSREDDYKQSLVKWDEWLAPDLNCMALRSISEGIIAASGKPLGRQTVEVTRIVLGDPSAELFAIPPTYTERSPSEVFREVDRRRAAGVGPKACASCDPSTNQKLDRVYHTARQQ